MIPGNLKSLTFGYKISTHDASTSFPVKKNRNRLRNLLTVILKTGTEDQLEQRGVKLCIKTV
jgi:hypothetical protein